MYKPLYFPDVFFTLAFVSLAHKKRITLLNSNKEQ